jgi:hypothetical protein
VDPVGEVRQNAWIIESGAMTADELRAVEERVASGSIDRTISATLERRLQVSVGSSAAARLLRVGPSTIARRRRKRELWGFQHNGAWRYPLWQFHGNGVLPGLRAVIAAVPPTMNPSTVDGIMTSPQRDLKAGGVPVTPRLWLSDGHPVEAVLVLFDSDARD